MQSGFSVCRRHLGKTYRKTLGVYNYKLGHQAYHKEPGAVNLHTVESLKNKGTYEGLMRLRKLRNESDRVMGKFQGRNFIVDKLKVPILEIPDLTGFELKPYVSYHTPQIDDETRMKMAKINDYNLNENLVFRGETQFLVKK